jgi:hypothetical protein
MRQGEDMWTSAHTRNAHISWSKASGDWGQVIPKMLKDKEIVVGATAIETAKAPIEIDGPIALQKP